MLSPLLKWIKTDTANCILKLEEHRELSITCDAKINKLGKQGRLYQTRLEEYKKDVNSTPLPTTIDKKPQKRDHLPHSINQP